MGWYGDTVTVTVIGTAEQCNPKGSQGLMVGYIHLLVCVSTGS